MSEADVGSYLERPLVVDETLEDRGYQVELTATATGDHTLVCLPTGLGKTAVSVLVTAHRLAEYGGKSLLLAPTKPLVEQHASFYRETLELPPEEIVVFTGEVRPDDRAATWADARVVIATPQVVENDLIGNRISLAEVTHCTFDECHRASGEYAYNFIAERYHATADQPLVTGMSASPGGNKEQILQVCRNLGLRDVAVMTEDDADVGEHTFTTEVEWDHIELPEEILEIRDRLTAVIRDRLEELRELGLTRKSDPSLSEGALRKLQAAARRLVNDEDPAGYRAMSLIAEMRKIRTAVTYTETQSIESLLQYFERQENAARSSGASKASQRFISDLGIKQARARAERYDDIHPKFRKTRILLAETLGIQGGERVIVFTESRDTAETLVRFLGQSFETRKFVGQSDREGSDGMNQTEQKETLAGFKRGDFEVLVSTSVAEEGLDVPDVDLVLFYEPVPKGVRSIQRKGRTGRQSEGKVVVLIADDTRDEAYYWMSRNEEKRMQSELRKLKELSGDIQAALTDTQAELARFEPSEAAVDPDDRTAVDDGTDRGTAPANAATDGSGQEPADGQAGLSAFEPGTDTDEQVASDGDTERTVDPPEADTDVVEIVVDQRELDASIARSLARAEGIETRLETLAVGDYVLSDRVVVERKSVEDFLDTLTAGDRSMFEQVGDAARQYARPVVILEGEDVYGRRNIHPNAIRGALASLAVDFGASVLQTDDEAGTAALLETIARREQERTDRSVSVHGEKSQRSRAEQQEYVVGAIGEVGPVTARTLLGAFGSVEAVMTATEEELLEVDGVGPVTAGRIREIVGAAYTD